MITGEETTPTNKCLLCETVIEGKPWLSVGTKGCIVHACSYHCGKNMNTKLGKGYWNDVINKEDFNEPRPTCQNKNKSVGDITTGFDLDDIRYEIEQEDQRIEMMEYEYDESSSDDDYFDGENCY